MWDQAGGRRHLGGGTWEKASGWTRKHLGGIMWEDASGGCICEEASGGGIWEKVAGKRHL